VTAAERAQVSALVEAAYVEALEVHGARSFNAGFIAELWAHTNAKRDLDALLSAPPEPCCGPCDTCGHQQDLESLPPACVNLSKGDALILCSDLGNRCGAWEPKEGNRG